MQLSSEVERLGDDLATGYAEHHEAALAQYMEAKKQLNEAMGKMRLAAEALNNAAAVAARVQDQTETLHTRMQEIVGETHNPHTQETRTMLGDLATNSEDIPALAAQRSDDAAFGADEIGSHDQAADDDVRNMEALRTAVGQRAALYGIVADRLVTDAQI